MAEFIGNVARKKGLLGAGGIPNVDQTCRIVIRDFLNGKIKYSTAPPEMEDDPEDDEEMS